MKESISLKSKRGERSLIARFVIDASLWHHFQNVEAKAEHRG
jgi:hypothetical protein